MRFVSVSWLKLLGTLFIAAFLLTGPVSAEEIPDCDRSAFGRYKQIDYMDTRSRLLIQSSIGPYEIQSNASGVKRVVFGSWKDPYTGRVHRDVDAQRMHVDHVIPICWAWDHGAHSWSREKRRAFYNDIRFLLIVERGLNSQKGAQGPDVWLPLKHDFTCDYIYLFMDGIEAYDLELSEVERSNLLDAKSKACDIEVSDAVLVAQ